MPKRHEVKMQLVKNNLILTEIDWNPLCYIKQSYLKQIIKSIKYFWLQNEHKKTVVRQQTDRLITTYASHYHVSIYKLLNTLKTCLYVNCSHWDIFCVAQYSYMNTIYIIPIVCLIYLKPSLFVIF